ncbi:winged helix-turn-helix domain-containing protein [Streptomyces sp. NPDC048362]|uniref:winged helix-turn-helix domain-containing protein n=1 Tax=Streptomyces sp. NPDC048362 TaxID=3365539 RepID=UPI0037151DDD
MEMVWVALEQGVRVHGFEAGLWTLERVGVVVTRVTGVVLSRALVWRLLISRLGWSVERPERRAVERDESENRSLDRAGVAARQKGGREHMCLERLPHRIRRLPAPSDPPHLLARSGLRSCGTA